MPRGSAGGQVQQQGNGAYFEALRPSEDRTPITPSGLVFSARPYVTGVERTTLSALARALYDNGGLPALAVNQIAFHSVPIVPMADTGDEDLNDVYEAYWQDWCQRCDFYGRVEMDFEALQEVICTSVDLDGDIGVALVSDAGFPQVQLIPGWRIASSTDGKKDRSMDGVMLDNAGRVTGYSVSAEDGSERIDVGEMMLVRDPTPSSWYRGLSPLRRGMNDLRDGKDILAFEKLAVKLNSSLIGVLEGGPIDEDHGFQIPDEGDGDEEDAEEGEPEEVVQSGLSRAEMLGGDIPTLPEGKKLARAESNRPNAQFDSFMDTLSAAFVSGMDLPPAFILDTKLTGPSVRSVIGKAQRKFGRRAAAMKRLVRWIWVRVMAWGIEHDGLPTTPHWDRVTFNQPAKATIDAGRESAQEREDNATGLMSRQEHYGNRGLPWKPEVDQLFNEEAYIIGKAVALSKESGVPVDSILARFGYEKAAPPKPDEKKTSKKNPKDDE